MAASAEVVGLVVGVGLGVLGLVGVLSSRKPKTNASSSSSSSIRRLRAPHVVVEQTPPPQTTTDWNRYFEKQIRTLSAMKKEFQKNAKNDDMDKENFAAFKNTYVQILNIWRKHQSALWSCLRESMRETRKRTQRTQLDTLIQKIESSRNQAFEMPMNTVQDVLRFADKANEQLENTRTLIQLVGNATYDACIQKMMSSFKSTFTA